MEPIKVLGIEVVEAYKLNATKSVLAERERELLELKGPCSFCRLHRTHAGPCASKREVV